MRLHPKERVPCLIFRSMITNEDNFKTGQYSFSTLLNFNVVEKRLTLLCCPSQCLWLFICCKTKSKKNFLFGKIFLFFTRYILFVEKTFYRKKNFTVNLFLKELGYSDDLVRGQILKSRKISRSEVLNKLKQEITVGLFLILLIIHCFRNLKMYYLKCSYY